MGFFKDSWQSVTNYLSSTKEEVVSEWDEFQDEIDQTSSYEQSNTSDVLQQTSNGISFVAETAGSLINNKSTRALASETLDDITDSKLYQDVSDNLSEASMHITKEVNAYLDDNPELKAHLHTVGQSIDEKIDTGIAYAKEVAAEHPEALRNIGAIGAVAAAVVPVAKGAKILAKAEGKVPNTYILTPERNREVFEEKILPELKDLDFAAKENPTLFFTGGLPGAGKSGIVSEIQAKHDLPQIVIADPDDFRKYHPDIFTIQEKFGHDASIITHPDASQFAKHTVNEALERKVNIIKDGTLNNAENLKKLVTQAKEKGFEQEITIKAVNEYESLEGVFGRYAHQYADKPNEARFVPPSFVKDSKSKIEETAESIKDLDVKAFKVIDRDDNLIYDQSIHLNVSPKEMMQKATNLKNYPKEKLEALEKNWDSTIDKLKEIDAPKNVQESARELRYDLAKELHPVSARVLTKDNAIVAGGVGTYIATNGLTQSLEENHIPLSNASMSLLPPDIATPNENIAEFLNKQNTQTETPLEYNTDGGVLFSNAPDSGKNVELIRREPYVDDRNYASTNEVCKEDNFYSNDNTYDLEKYLPASVRYSNEANDSSYEDNESMEL